MTSGCFKNIAAHFVFALCVWGLPCRAQTIDLRNDETLLPVFQAGVFPRHVLGLETSRCEALDQSVAILLKGDKRVEMKAKSLTFGVYTDDRLSFVQAYTDYITVDEAEREAAKLHREFGITQDRMNRFLGEVRQRWQYDDGYSAATKTEPKVSIFFLRGASPERPLRLAVNIQWFRTMKERDPRSIPIVPPPGFEHVDMSPIRKRSRPSVPESSDGAATGAR